LTAAVHQFICSLTKAKDSKSYEVAVRALAAHGVEVKVPVFFIKVVFVVAGRSASSG
jgi:hypothetical protein